jgi:hypothetical protein
VLEILPSSNKRTPRSHNLLLLEFVNAQARIGLLARIGSENTSEILGVLLFEEGKISNTLKEKKIMRLLLKIKNGTPAVRKVALRTIADKARELGAGPLFDKILSVRSIRSGKILSNSGPAPSSRALSAIVRSATLR